jgi:histidinol-phosphate phosphatase family protein
MIIDKTWTLFLDRDGVINQKKENDYVKSWEEFIFLDGSLEAISIMSNIFCRIIVVTNQRGIGRGIFSLEELNSIHKKMISTIELNSGKIDKIYFCTEVSDQSECRKPNSGMAFEAKSDFDEIEFEKSIIVGDSKSDMEFGKKLGFKRVLINSNNSKNIKSEWFDLSFISLLAFANFIVNEYQK